MKKNLTYFLMFLTFLSIFTTSFAEEFANNQKLFSASDSVFENIEILYIASGLSMPSSSGPWSSAELRAMINYIDTRTLSESMQILYKSVKKQLFAQPDKIYENTLGLSSSFIFTPEMYTHSNSTDFDQENDWYYGFEERADMLKIPLEGWVENNIYFRSDLSLGIDSGGITYDNTSDTFYGVPLSTNIYPLYPSTIRNLNVNIPDRSVFSFGSNHWNVAMGRDVVEWGAGESGNLVVGGNMKYETYGRFSAFYNNFKFSALGLFYPHPETTANSSQNSLFTGTKVYLVHRLETTLFNHKVSIALDEAIMYQSSDNTFDLRIFNPVNIYHNYFIRANANSIIALNVDYAFYPGWNLYNQIVVDEYHFGEPNPNEGEAGAHPDAYGFLFGIKNTSSIKQGVLKTVLEGVYTSPYLYLREAYEDGKYGVSFYSDYRDYCDDAGGLQYYSYCNGYEYGGDSITGTLKTTYQVADAWSVGAELFYMAHGIIDSEEDYGDGVLDGGEIIPTTPATTSPLYDADGDGIVDEKTGEVEHTFRLSLNGSYTILQNLEVYANNAFYIIINKDNELQDPVNDIQLSIGVKYTW